MKTSLILPLLLTTLLTTVAIADHTIPKPKQSTQVIDKVIAIVNNDVITQRQVDRAYNTSIKQIKAQGQPIPDESTLKQQILDQLIYQELQLQLAKRYKVKVTNAQVTNAIQNIAKQNKISLNELKMKVQQQGLSYAEYRKEIKKQIIMTIIQRQALSSQVKVTKNEIDKALEAYKNQKDYAQQYHIINVLIPTSAAATTKQQQQASAKATQIAQSLRHGSDILKIEGAIVRDMGWQSSETLPNLFLNRLKKMKKKDVAGPLLADNGYHIIKLVGIKASRKPLPSREQVKRILTEQKFQQALQQWLPKLRKQAYVKIVKPQ